MESAGRRERAEGKTGGGRDTERKFLESRDRVSARPLSSARKPEGRLLTGCSLGKAFGVPVWTERLRTACVSVKALRHYIDLLFCFVLTM